MWSRCKKQDIAGGFYAEGGEVESQYSYGVSARAAVTSSQGTNYGVYAQAYGALENYAIWASAPPASDDGTAQNNNESGLNIKPMQDIGTGFLVEMFTWSIIEMVMHLFKS